MNAALILGGAAAFNLHHTNAGFKDLSPIDCAVPTFNQILNIPLSHNVTNQITHHIGRKIVSKSLKAAFWPFSDEVDNLPSPDPTKIAAPSWEGSQNGNDKLMGQQSLKALKQKLEAQLNQSGLWSQVFSHSESNEELTNYLESSYVQNLVDNIIGDIQVHVLPNLTVSVRSSMVNLGEAICQVPEDYDFADNQGDESKLPLQTREKHICATHAFIKQSLVCNSRTNVTGCDNRASFPSYDDRMISCQVPTEQNFSQFKFDPESIQVDPLNQVSLYQGNLDRWLLNGVNVLYQFAKYDSACDGKYDDRKYLPGWNLVSAIEMDYADIAGLNQTRKSSPFSVLLEKPEKTCEFVILNRGSLFKSDWMLDFDYELVPFKTLDGKTSLGHMTKGYASVSIDSAQKIAADIKARNCTVPSSITIAGHSMGGVIGGGQALLLKSLYPDTKFNLIAFGAPSSIDQKLSQNILDQLAVTRSWTLEFDPVTQIPCHSMMPFCDLDSQKWHKTVAYTSLPNTIKINNKQIAKPMPSMNQKSFGTISYNLFTQQLHLDKIQFPAPTLVAQTHTCAYTCWFDHEYCSPEKAESICKMCSQL